MSIHQRVEKSRQDACTCAEHVLLVRSADLCGAGSAAHHFGCAKVLALTLREYSAMTMSHPGSSARNALSRWCYSKIRRELTGRAFGEQLNFYCRRYCPEQYNQTKVEKPGMVKHCIYCGHGQARNGGSGGERPLRTQAKGRERIAPVCDQRTLYEPRLDAVMFTDKARPAPTCSRSSFRRVSSSRFAIVWCPGEVPWDGTTRFSASSPGSCPTVQVCQNSFISL